MAKQNCEKKKRDEDVACEAEIENATDDFMAWRSKLPRMVDEIMDHLRDLGSVRRVSPFALPSEEGIVKILGHLTEIIFPGFSGRQDIDPANLNYHVGSAVGRVYDLLAEQITKCVRHECKRAKSPQCSHCVLIGYQKAFELLELIPEITRLLEGDIKAAYEGDPAATGDDEIIFCYPGMRAIFIQRIAHQIHTLGVPLLPRIMTEYAHRITGIDIHPGADIGENFFIDHGTGVVIGETTEIGKNVKLYQGVTLGALSFPRDEKGNLKRGVKRHPTIEDDVVIYSNASILGPVRIGHGSVIGGNVFLTHDVEPDTRVTIETPKLKMKSRNSGAAS